MSEPLRALAEAAQQESVPAADEGTAGKVAECDSKLAQYRARPWTSALTRSPSPGGSPRQKPRKPSTYSSRAARSQSRHQVVDGAGCARRRWDRGQCDHDGEDDFWCGCKDCHCRVAEDRAAVPVIRGATQIKRRRTCSSCHYTTRRRLLLTATRGWRRCKCPFPRSPSLPCSPSRAELCCGRRGPLGRGVDGNRYDRAQNALRCRCLFRPLSQTGMIGAVAAGSRSARMPLGA